MIYEECEGSIYSNFGTKRHYEWGLGVQRLTNLKSSYNETLNSRVIQGNRNQ